MTKSDLIRKLSTKENLTEKNATEIVNLFFDGFGKTLRKGKKIAIRGFGSFCVRRYGAYMGRNPKTGEKIRVNKKKGVLFKAGKELKESLNK